jgi:tRNA U34 2-thiouridine synthase MnmA/TrmU
MKAISLISGGLDSTLATKLMVDQGIEVIGLNCRSPFCQCDHGQGCKSTAREITKKFGIELRQINTSLEFLEVIKNPAHGYGSNINPCIDCRILMLKKAKELMQEIGASFIITGEVLGQRPMSQKGPTLRLIEKEAGLVGFVVRPLSAKVLEPTEPEKLGWIDREKMLSVSGRGRKEQISLAKEFNINDYPCPAGGCLLTNEGYANKVRDLIKYNELTLENIVFLKIGRHFRVGPYSKLIVGRDEKENLKLLDMAKDGDFVFEPSEEIKGPVAIGRGEFKDEKQIELSISIVGRYCDDGPINLQIKVRKFPSDFKEMISCQPFKDSELFSFRI